MAPIDLMISPEFKMEGILSKASHSLEASLNTVNGTLVGEISKDATLSYYNGEYTVTPQAHKEQVLETKNKCMIDDLTVLRVPYFETSNIYGNTVFIASEV